MKFSERWEQLKIEAQVHVSPTGRIFIPDIYNDLSAAFAFKYLGIYKLSCATERPERYIEQWINQNQLSTQRVKSHLDADDTLMRYYDCLIEADLPLFLDAFETTYDFAYREDATKILNDDNSVDYSDFHWSQMSHFRDAVCLILRYGCFEGANYPVYKENPQIGSFLTNLHATHKPKPSTYTDLYACVDRKMAAQTVLPGLEIESQCRELDCQVVKTFNLRKHTKNGQKMSNNQFITACLKGFPQQLPKGTKFSFDNLKQKGIYS